MHYARRRYIVDWKLQGPICLHALFYGGLVLAAIVIGIFLPLVWELGSANQPVGYEERSIVMLYLHDRLWWLMLGCAAIVAVSAIRLSHRIAGPLVRYKRNLRLLAEGKLPTPLRTRDADFLKEEVACLNEAVAGVQHRIAAIRRAHAVLATEIASVAMRAASAPAPDCTALLTASRDLEQAVAAFAAHDTGDDRRPVEQQAAVALAGNGLLP